MQLKIDYKANAFGGTFAKPHKPTLKPSFAKEPPSQRTKDRHEMTTNKHDRQEGQQLTAVWRNGGFSASYDSFVVGSSAVLRLNFCAKNPPLRQAAKRYVPL